MPDYTIPVAIFGAAIPAVVAWFSLRWFFQFLRGLS